MVILVIILPKLFVFCCLYLVVFMVRHGSRRQQVTNPILVEVREGTRGMFMGVFRNLLGNYGK